MNTDQTITQVPPGILEQLPALDACTVSNAIERLDVRLRNEGFTDISVAMPVAQPASHGRLCRHRPNSHGLGSHGSVFVPRTHGLVGVPGLARTLTRRKGSSDDNRYEYDGI